MYPSSKASQPSGDARGKANFKRNPHDCQCKQLWQIYLGARMIHILPQDDDMMFVNMVPTRLRQLQKTSPKEEVPTGSQHGTWGRGVLLVPPCKEVLGTQLDT